MLSVHYSAAGFSILIGEKQLCSSESGANCKVHINVLGLIIPTVTPTHHITSLNAMLLINRSVKKHVLNIFGKSLQR